MIHIYKITNSVNGKVYIGSTNDVTGRFGKHKRELNKSIHHNEHLQRAWNKYGCDSFKFETLMVCSNNERNHCEQMFMDLYNSQNHDYGYNICDADGHSLSEETRLKMSESHKGKKRKPFTDEHKRNLSQSMKGRKAWNKNIPRADDVKNKISETKTLSYARIIKNGVKKHKQQYAIRFNGKNIRHSSNIDLLKQWFEDNYPNEELVTDA